VSHRYVVLGAGRQGVAIAYDLARNGQARAVVMVDAHRSAADAAVERLRRLLPDGAAEIRAARVDVSDRTRLVEVLRGAHVAVSAVPYPYNVAVTDAAIEAPCCLCDLGGNTAVVREQLARDAAARQAGVSIVPDCGLAPGLGNHLAALGVASLEQPQEVHIRCGGLPERPIGPLGYKLLFHFDGLINEYSGVGEFLRDGRRIQVPALTELEPIDFGPPLGRCEAAVTSGGTSTCPDTYSGKLLAYDYKTVRYPGHFAILRALVELGCFEERVRLPEGVTLEPRAMMQRLFEARLGYPEVRDVVVLRVTVSGRHAGAARTVQYDLFDQPDDRSPFTAMERTTGFPTAVVALLQARGEVPPGARPLEVSVPPQRFFDELPRHDIRVRVTTGGVAAGDRLDGRSGP
jgi:lysine 6-dehydrogenase